MMKRIGVSLLLCCAAAAAQSAGGSGVSAGNRAATAAVACLSIATGPSDGPAASPENHTVLFENADVRVLDVHSRPHTREAIHTHVRPAVMYVDQQGAGTYRTPDNSRNESHPTNPDFKPRTFATKPEGPHWTENTGEVPFHAVRVEFKHPGCGLAGWHAAQPAADDVLAVAPGAATVLLENDDVRVLDVRLPPHGTEPIHSHPWPGVVYVAEGAGLRRIVRGDMVQEQRLPAPGQVLAEPAARYFVENVGDTPLHLVRFELKYGTAVQ